MPTCDYNVYVISTIVDLSTVSKVIQDYNVYVISTIVDFCSSYSWSIDYNVYVISTIVDSRKGLKEYEKTIMSM